MNSPAARPITSSGAGSTGTLDLGTSLPLINADVSINGPGATNLIVSGQNASRVFSPALHKRL